MRNSYLTVLVATLLLVRYLVLQLDTASAGFNHLLGQQVGRFSVTETSVNVCDDRHNVSFKVVDLSDSFSFECLVARFTRSVQFTEEVIQFPSISLLEESV